MDFPDNLLMVEDLEYLDNITSCNKVENCLMLSEYEQNLIKETESPNSHRRSRKWSIFKQPTLQVKHQIEKILPLGDILLLTGSQKSFCTFLAIKLRKLDGKKITKNEAAERLYFQKSYICIDRVQQK